jgi:hypothetical protein
MHITYFCWHKLQKLVQNNPKLAVKNYLSFSFSTALQTARQFDMKKYHHDVKINSKLTTVYAQLGSNDALNKV